MEGCDNLCHLHTPVQSGAQPMCDVKADAQREPSLCAHASGRSRFVACEKAATAVCVRRLNRTTTPARNTSTMHQVYRITIGLCLGSTTSTLCRGIFRPPVDVTGDALGLAGVTGSPFGVLVARELAECAD